MSDDDRLAGYLRSVDEKPFLGLTLYYPVARPSPARDCGQVAGHACDPDAGNAYRATLHAVGITDFAIHRLRATPNGWRTEEVRH